MYRHRKSWRSHPGHDGKSIYTWQLEMICWRQEWCDERIHVYWLGPHQVLLSWFRWWEADWAEAGCRHANLQKWYWGWDKSQGLTWWGGGEEHRWLQLVASIAAAERTTCTDFGKERKWNKWTTDRICRLCRCSKDTGFPVLQSECHHFKGHSWSSLLFMAYCVFPEAKSLNPW